MPRRLLNRTGGGTGTPSRSTQAPEADEPVNYEPPSFPLNDVAIANLGGLSQTRDTLLYQNLIKDSLRNLGHAVYDLHDRLRNQRERLEQLQRRRDERGLDKSPEEERLEKHVAELERKIGALTKRSEQSVRQTIDKKTALEDDAAVISALFTTASSNRNNAPEQLEGEDDEGGDETPSAPSTLDALREQRAQKLGEYAATPHYQRYALDNEYAAFKKLWHDALAGDDGPPLPDASKWFHADGAPVMTLSGIGAGDDDAEDSENDLAVAREIRSLNCPLTLRPLEEPYSNKKCKHTFEKAAILDYLDGRQPKQCPQTGCSQVRLTLLQIASETLLGPNTDRSADFY